MIGTVLARARADDGEAFRELVEPYCGELQTHCYRILGSVQDAEDVLQEALLAACVPCQNSRNSSELVFSLLVRPLSDTR
jgi:DNA-directed RNA polymerase specialized sigma24 family protein